MLRLFFSGLRGRLLALILLTTLPTFGIVLYTWTEAKKDEADRTTRDAEALIGLISREHDRIINRARIVLGRLSELPDARSGDAVACGSALAARLREYPRFVNFGVARPDGRILCSALPMKAPVTAADRPWFQRSIDTRRFSTGEYQLGRISAKPVLVFGYPLFDQAGKTQSVFFGAVDLAWMSEYATDMNLLPGSILLVIERGGLILGRYPNPEKWAGRLRNEAEIVNRARAQGSAGASEATGTDGIKRLYVFRRLGSEASLGEAYVALGVPLATVYAASNTLLFQSLLVLAAICALALTAAWYGGYALILRPLNSLIAATRRLRAGDLSARSRESSSIREVSDLDAAFNEMAETLETSYVDLKYAHEALRRSEQRLRNVIDGLGPQIFVGLMTPEGKLIEANKSALEATGFKPEDVLGRPFAELSPWCYSEEVQRQLRDALALAARGEPSRYDVKLRVGENHFIDIDFSLQPLRDESGKVVFLVPSANIITERKQAEEALRRSEQRLRAIIETAPECVKVLAPDGTLLEMNAAGLRMLDADAPEQVIGQNVESLIGIEHRQNFAALNRRVFSGETGTLEFEVIGLKGTRRWLETHATPLRDENNRITGLLGVTRDVTKRKRARQALRDGEERLRLALEAAQMGTFDWEIPDNRITWSPGHEKLWGFAPGEFAGTYESFSERVHRDDLPGINAAVSRCIAERLPWVREFRVVWLDGSVHWILGRGEFDFAADGRPVRMRGVVLEITAAKEAEMALKENQRRLATLIENLPGVVYRGRNDKDRTAEFISEGVLRLTGYPSSDFSEPFRHFGRLIHPDDQGRVWDQVQAALDERSPYEITYRIATATGAEKWVWEQGCGVFDAHGRLLALEGFVSDITERKRTEQSLDARYRELQRLHEISQAILLSDDLQTMAAAILDKAVAISGCDIGLLRLADRVTGRLEPVASYGYRNAENVRRHHASMINKISQRLMRTFILKRAVIVQRVQEDAGLRTFKSEGVQALIGVPVLVHDEVFGVLQLGSRTKRTFDPGLVRFLETVGSNLGIAVQKSRLLEETLTVQARLRGLSHKLVENQETERRYIARELHDEIGSLLTGLKLTLGVNGGQGIEQAQAIIDEVLAKVRSLSQGLRPPMLDDLGLLPTLSWHIKEFTARSHVHVEFQNSGLERRFPQDIEIAAYRIVQEALTNIARYARARTATIKLWADSRTLGIEVVDQGIGFDQEKILAQASGGGLTGMRERVTEFNGAIIIASEPGAGTRIMVELPLAQAEESGGPEIQ